jgi:hypothetical protein
MNGPSKGGGGGASPETTRERIDREVKEEMAANEANAAQRIVKPDDRHSGGWVAEIPAVLCNDAHVLTEPIAGLARVQTCILEDGHSGNMHRSDTYSWVKGDHGMTFPSLNDAAQAIGERMANEEEEEHPDPEYLRGYNDAMILRDSQDLNEKKWITTLHTIDQQEPVGIILHHKNGSAERIMFQEIRPIGEGGLGGAAWKEDQQDDEPKPGPWTSIALEDVTGILGHRGHAYAIENEFENFEQQASMADVSLRSVFRGALGQKLTREKATHQRLAELEAEQEIKGDEWKSAEYAALELQWLDSIRDICGYALLMFGWAKRLTTEGEDL